MMELTLEFEYCEELQAEIEEQMNDDFEIILNEEHNISAIPLPVDEYNLMPGVTSVISVCISVAGQIAIGVVTEVIKNWLIDLNIKSVKIENTVCTLNEEVIQKALEEYAKNHHLKFE